mgnify:CR=1
MVPQPPKVQARECALRLLPDTPVWGALQTAKTQHIYFALPAALRFARGTSSSLLSPSASLDSADASSSSEESQPTFSPGSNNNATHKAAASTPHTHTQRDTVSDKNQRLQGNNLASRVSVTV